MLHSVVLSLIVQHYLCLYFFFNDTATTEIYTLSLHDALPISIYSISFFSKPFLPDLKKFLMRFWQRIGKQDRKSTRLNSSHTVISYAVFCLKKKKKHSTGAMMLFTSVKKTRISWTKSA